MRNTLQYPITKDEVINALDSAIEDHLSSGLVGGIQAAALIKAKELVLKQGPDFFYEAFDPRSPDDV